MKAIGGLVAIVALFFLGFLALVLAIEGLTATGLSISAAGTVVLALVVGWMLYASNRATRSR